MPENATLTCGDFGGRKTDGSPCRRRTRGRCPAHPETGDPGAAAGGRPAFAFTEEQYEQIAKLAALGMTHEMIADFFEIGDRTLRRRLVDDERAARAYARGIAQANAKIAQTIFQRAIQGDRTLLIWWEKTRAGKSEKQRVEHTVTRKSFEEWVRELPDSDLRRLQAMGGDALLEEYERACPPAGGD